ncbi:protein O-mannosyl-transferase TMTC4-like [Oncorhynchus tshawytscha]|uniref:protein O-mannosyl-transferase TMTC4-like n=1 Tax=Oncorhynchus tshawytscha TaxID=74940 RepID=UPI000D09ABE5|nr:protein O-mannosyl-transferase TMTC4-like [Oncorhynchus tshawytscha]
MHSPHDLDFLYQSVLLMSIPSLSCCLGNLSQVEVIGRDALKLLPNDHTIMFSLANVLGKLQKHERSFTHHWGKLELAKKHYERSLMLEPEAPGIQDNLLQCKLDQLYMAKPP